MGELREKVAFVTGGTAGIGEAAVKIAGTTNGLIIGYSGLYACSAN